MRTKTGSRRAFTGLAAATGLAGVWAAGCSPSGKPPHGLTACVEAPADHPTGPWSSIASGTITAPIVITGPGRYVVLGDITLDPMFAGSAGIVVAANVSDVTIDLNGHTIDGAMENAAGVLAEANTSAVCLINGTVKNFTGHGVDLSAASGAVIARVASRANTGDGFHLGTGGNCANSTSEDNKGDGLEGDDDTMITGTYVANNTQWGINFGSGSGDGAFACTVSGNGAGGVDAGTETTLVSCSIQNNSGKGVDAAGALAWVTHCTVEGNAGTGIAAGTNSIIAYNDVSRNTGIGIDLGAASNCTVTGNSLHDNTSYAIKGNNNNPVTANFARGGTADGVNGPYRIVVFGPIQWGLRARLNTSPADANANVYE